MRILYHHRTQGVGAEGVHIRGIVTALRKANCDVYIVSPPGIDPFIEEYPDKITEDPDNNLKILGFLAEYLPQVFFEFIEIFYNFYSFFSIIKIIKNCKIDCIYERYAFFSFSGIILSRFYKLPFILEANSTVYMKSHSRPLKLKFLIKLFEKYIYSRADKIITVSNYLKRIIIEHHALSDDKIIVMSNAIDPARFNSKNISTNLIKKRFPIKEKYIVGFVGAFVKWHGISFLITSLAPILKKYNIHIFIVGDGPIKNDIQQQIVNLKISTNVTITGFVKSNEIPSYIEIMDICVMPDSNVHGSPVKIFEYMAMGKPIVAPKYEPIMDIIVDGENGRLFTPRDSATFSKIIIDLIQNKDLMKKIGEKAKYDVFRKHTWDQHAWGIISLYKNIGKK